jgi:hypothetical protein
VTTVVGCTGHQVMPPEAREHAEREIRHRLAAVGPGLVGLSALAVGADQMFAEAIGEAGGRLKVIVPSDGYEHTFVLPEDLRSYQRLLTRAETIVTLPFAEPSQAAFFAAGQTVVDECDLLYAVWDGRPAQGFGGSADVVRYARSQGKPVLIIWPEGVSR